MLFVEEEEEREREREREGYEEGVRFVVGIVFCFLVEIGLVAVGIGGVLEWERGSDLNQWLWGGVCGERDVGMVSVVRSVDWWCFIES